MRLHISPETKAKIKTLLLNPHLYLIGFGFIVGLTSKFNLYHHYREFVLGKDYILGWDTFYLATLKDILLVFASEFFVFAVLLLLFVLVKRFLSGRFGDVLLLFINTLYATLAVVNAYWARETGTILSATQVKKMFSHTGDALLLATGYLTFPTLVLIGFLLFLTIRHYKKYHPEIGAISGKKLLIFGAALIVISMSYHALTLQKSVYTHPQLLSATKNIYISLTKQIFKREDTVMAVTEDWERTTIERSTHKPNIIILIMESTRFLSTPFSNASNTASMPYLSQLAKEGLLVEKARAPLPHTTKSIINILTGNYAIPGGDLTETQFGYQMTSLPAYLKNIGYSSAFMQSAVGEFERRPSLVHNMGYDHFLTAQQVAPESPTIQLSKDDFLILDPALEWAKEQTSPFLLTVLTSVTHHPYIVPTRKDYDQLSRQFYRGMSPEEKYELYKEALNYQDSFIESLLTGLREQGDLGNSIVVLVGDHGEGFAEHGRLAHSENIYEEGLRVPLVFYGPGYFEKGSVLRDRYYSQIDILPTLFDLMGVTPFPKELEGRSLFAKPEERNHYFTRWDGTTGMGVLLPKNQKVIFNRDVDSIEIYDLNQDPWEKENLYASMRDQIDFSLVLKDLLEWKSRTYRYVNKEDESDKVLYGWNCGDSAQESCELVTSPHEE